MSFINAALAFGALLFAVPLVIHLLNRQRFRRRQWAAMEYLLRAFKKQRRRLRTENLILLLLRCLIPVLLALAIARPVLMDDGGILPTAGTAHHVFVIDRSFSMGFQPAGNQSAHSRAVQIATRRLEQIEGKTGQTVSLVLAGIRPLMPIKTSPNLASVRTRLAQLGPPTDSAESLVPALVQVAELIEDEKERPGAIATAETRVYIFTDLQQRSFGEEFLARGRTSAEPPADPTVVPAPATPPTSGAGDEAEAGEAAGGLLADSTREVLDRLRKVASLTVMDMGNAAGGAEDNVQITGLSLQEANAVVGVPLTASVKVRNLSGTTQNVQVTLEKDGGEPIRRLVRVEAGADSDVELQVLFRETGSRILRASIENDGLDADNTCWRVVDVAERLRLLLVEGSLATEWRLMDSGWLRKVLDPTEGSGEANVAEFETKVVDSTTFLLGQEKLQDYDAVVLAGVEQLTETVASELSAAVEAGTGLLIMLSERCQPESYNLHLYRSGDGPMPIRLHQPQGYEPGGERFYRSQIVDLQHPVFSDFAAHEPLLQALQLAAIYRYFTCDRDSLTDAGQILWQITSPELSPLLVAGRHGEGRTLLLTSPVTQLPKNRRWNTLEAQIHSIPLFHPMAHWLSHPVTDPYNVTVGAGLTAIVRERPADLAVVVPDRAGSSKVPVARDVRPLRGGMFSLPLFTQTEFAGVYSFEMRLGDAEGTGQLQLPFAVNIDPAEGELEYLSHAALRDRLGLKNVYVALPDELEEEVPGGSSDLGPLLLYLVLGFVLGEASWARFVSRRRA